MNATCEVTCRSAATIAAGVREGRLSAVALVESLLARIHERNGTLNCYTEVLSARALREAARVDAMVQAGQDPGPLAGVPFGVKDNYDVAGRVTLAGSIINRDLPPATQDAVLVRRLGAAGAVLVGTHNMDELAYGFTTENAHYGATRNPLDPARSAGGSSGGSAAAVAAGLAQFALGTDTNGSIRVPSSFCGLFGLKPTFGRLPRTGTFPFVHDLDHLGPFARSAADLTLVYDVVQGHAPGDHACVEAPPQPVSPVLDQPVGDLAVGVLGGWFAELADDQGRAAVARVAKALGGGETVILPGTERARAAAFVLTCASGANLHIEKLKSAAGDFDPATRDRLLAGTLIPASAVLQAQRVRTLYRQEVLAALARTPLLLAPATPCSAPLLGQPTITVAGRALPTRPNIGLLTQPLSFVGVPIASFPVVSEGLPIGVQLIAAPWREDIVLRAAAFLERAGLSGPVEVRV